MRTLYLDTRPKERPEDFYNREKELGQFVESLKQSRLVLVTAPRRYGKTSLIKVGLRVARRPYVYVDCGQLGPGMLGISDLAQAMAHALDQVERRRRWLRAVLEVLRLASKSKPTLERLGRGPATKSMASVVEMLADLNIVLVFDDAHELRRLARHRFDLVVASILENTDSLAVVLAGPKEGVLHGVLRLDRPNTPLSGYDYRVVELSPLSPQQSEDFLVKGFRQRYLTPLSWLIGEIVRRLDGVIGWLAYVGYKLSASGDLTRESLGQAMESAKKQVLKELEQFLGPRKGAAGRYIAILRSAAQLGYARWGQLYRRAEELAGAMPKPVFNRLLKRLVEEGFIVKNGGYRLADPVLKELLISQS